MFKGAHPTGQPRTLRTIAESKNLPESFVTDERVHLMDDNNDKHFDEAVAALPTVADARRKLTAADKQPFTNVRK
jgi:hypothetical protein